jgi:hypothetical protein
VYQIVRSDSGQFIGRIQENFEGLVPYLTGTADPVPREAAVEADLRAKAETEFGPNDPPSPIADLLIRLMEEGGQFGGYAEVKDLGSYASTLTQDPDYLVTVRDLPARVPADLAAQVNDPVVVAEKMAMLADLIEYVTGADYDRSADLAAQVLRAAHRAPEVF